jgi:hypothetical protein
VIFKSGLDLLGVSDGAYGPNLLHNFVPFCMKRWFGFIYRRAKAVRTRIAQCDEPVSKSLLT